MSFSFIKESAQGLYVSVKLQPRASRNKLGGKAGDELKIYVTAPPVDSAANKALIQLMADTLDLPKRMVQLVKGQTSRSKTLLVQGMNATQFGEKISPLIE